MADMEQIVSLIGKYDGVIRLEVKAEDLQKFANLFVCKLVGEFLSRQKEERLLTSREVMSMCGVCAATLWHWNRRGVLKAVKVGGKVRYRPSDVKRVLGMEKKAEDGQPDAAQYEGRTCHD